MAAWLRFGFPGILALGLPLLFPQSLEAQLGDKSGEEQHPQGDWKIPASPALPAPEALKTLRIDPDYAVELVAAEPQVEDPVAMTFDSDGRLWVAEMRAFMPHLNATEDDEAASVGRIAVLQDTDRDGYYETVRHFAEGLRSPRTLALSRDGLLVNDGNALFHLSDTDNDGRADRRVLVDPKYIEGGNVEHQPNGLLLGMDGWHYNAKSRKRYRFRNGTWEIGQTERRGQWGITKDNHGRLFYNYNWDQLRGDLAPPNTLDRNPHHSSVAGLNLPVSIDQRVFPIRPNTGVNRGYRPNILDTGGKLRAFASACAPHIYRGDLLPELVGDAFVCGPGANIIKRNHLHYSSLQITSSHAYPDREFLASTDERFRPVFTCDGPDGALYFVDLYRGIIQHRAFMTTYLRREIEARQLDQPIHLGRIYRIVPRGHTFQPRPAPSATVADLAHSNGWHRDTAQRLLIEQADPTLVPSLRAMALDHEQPLGQKHALWTLSQLGDPHSEQLLPLLQSSSPEIVVTAMQTLEALAIEAPSLRRPLRTALLALTDATSPDVLFHLALSLGSPDLEWAKDQRVTTLTQLAKAQGGNALMRDAIMSSAAGVEFLLLQQLWPEAGSNAEWLPLAEAIASALMRERSSHHLGNLIALLGENVEQYHQGHHAVLSGMALHAQQRRFRPITLGRAPTVLTQSMLENVESALPPQARLLSVWPRLFAWPGHAPEARTQGSARALSPEESRQFAGGRLKYGTLCAACHGSKGTGIEPLAPPLLDSEWVLGEPERLVRILLHGMEGPVHVNGERYAPPKVQPFIPPLMALPDDDLASIMTFIRRAWSHRASPVSPRLVTQVRSLTTGREKPWTETELLAVKPLP